MEKILKKEIFYIRHAEPDSTRCCGISKCDIGLSDNGLKQAQLLSERFEGRHFDRIFTSPMIRCIQTAAEVSKRLSNPPEIVIIPEIIENGALPEYRCPDIEFFKKYYSNISFLKESIYEFTTGSNREDYINKERAEVLAQYFKSVTQYGERTLVFCHGSFGNYYIPAAVEMGSGNYILSLSHASVSKIKYTSDGKQRISFLNDISHLRPIMKDYEFDT